MDSSEELSDGVFIGVWLFARCDGLLELACFSRSEFWKGRVE